MTKNDICNLIYEQTGIQRKDVLAVLDAYVETVKNEVAKGETVSMRNFGTFTTKYRKPKAARDILRNITITLPGCVIPAFKPAKIFSERVKEANSDLTDIK